MSDTKEITVQGILVEVSQPYAEGHVCNAAEAKALNQTRGENIANNTRKEIKEMIEAAGGEPNDKVREAATKLVAEKDAAYEFTLASVGGGATRLDPLTKECRKLASDYIVDQIRQKGMTKKAWIEAQGENGEQAFKDKVVELSEHEQIVKLAKKNIAERSKMADLSVSI